MILRYPADRRTMAWAVAMPLVALTPYAWPSLATWLWPVSCYLALAAGVVAHNHNHCQTFKNRRLNSIFGQFLSVFYGYPTFAWVPTHNLNHHKFVNRIGDATITWRYTNAHHFPMAFAFPFISERLSGHAHQRVHPQGEGHQARACTGKSFVSTSSLRRHARRARHCSPSGCMAGRVACGCGS